MSKITALKGAVSALAVMAVMAGSIAPAAAQQAPAATAATAPPAAQSEDARLAAFFQQAFMEGISQTPEGLTQMGSKERYGELGDYTDTAAVKAQELAHRQLDQLHRQFDPARLSPSSRLSYRLFEINVAQGDALFAYRFHNYAVSNNGTAISGIPVLLINAHAVASVADAEAYISRLRAMDRVGGEVAADIDYRTAHNFISPDFVFEPVLKDTRAQLTGAPFDSGPDHPLFADFKTKVNALSIDQAAKDRLIADAREALLGSYRSGVSKVISAVERMGRKASSSDGVWRLPDGQAYYAATVKFFTTTNLTPDQIHQIGLSEVARIRGEMETIKTRVGFQGTLAEFIADLKTNPKYRYPNTPEGKAQYLADSKRIIADYMAIASTQFSRLPKAPIEVRAVESWRENTASGAFYDQPTPDGSRPGIFYVNLSDMSQVARINLEALAYHEGTPGHHFQIARALEQEDLPLFRQFGYQGAYIEGWGLYAERLGKEAGLYRDPYQDMGRLSMEIYRAARLVVDTGLHSKRWTRDQAMQYFRDNTLVSELDIQREINRYIANPGQATCYKIGQLKILELREKARAALGARFDIRDFHEVVLANGALPLDVLEEQVDAYITARKAA
ncbi:MAG: DUF885 domain-containing protein [Caulobacteraceae bacterium]|nr:DUF885 domain-containing protein [Caulobacteraceae bacterium]